MERQLSGYAKDMLREIAACGDLARQGFNPGACERLERDGLVEVFLKDSPFSTHRRRNKEPRRIQHLRLTKAGQDYVASLGAKK
jgi:hypothetical protein